MQRQFHWGSGCASWRSQRVLPSARLAPVRWLSALVPVALPAGLLLAALLTAACGPSASTVPDMPEFKEGRRYLEQQAQREAYYEHLRRYRDEKTRQTYAASLARNQQDWEAIGIHAPSEWVPPPEKPDAHKR